MTAVIEEPYAGFKMVIVNAQVYCFVFQVFDKMSELENNHFLTFGLMGQE